MGLQYCCHSGEEKLVAGRRLLGLQCGLTQPWQQLASSKNTPIQTQPAQQTARTWIASAAWESTCSQGHQRY